MTDRSIELTRRKILGSVTAVGIAGAGAGLGTSALFSDEESFTNNTIVAGELNLALSYTTEYNGVGGGFEVDEQGTVDGGVGLAFSLTDVKPGDSGRGRICFSLIDNPGYVWFGAGIKTDAENGVTEPEANHSSGAENDPQGSTSGGPQTGELAEALNSNWWYENSSPANLTDDGDSDQNISGDLFDDDFNAGVQLDGNPSTAGVDPFTADNSVPSSKPYTHCIGFSWELPASVGNEVQSDSVTFPIKFFTEQARNNSNPDSPIANVIV